MTPLVIQWNCAACKDIVTANFDTRAKEMAAAEINAEDTGFKGPKCFRATLGGFKCSRATATVCTQCLDWTEKPLAVSV